MAKKKSKALIWALLGLLIIGLGGFGAINLDSSMAYVATVGDQKLPIQQYARELQNRMNQLGQQLGTQLTFDQAQAFGIPNQVLSDMIVRASLNGEADDIGVSVGDGSVRDSIVAMPAFAGPDGDFSRDAYNFALDRAGMSESEFEESLRDDTSRSVLQGAVVNAVTMPDIYAETLAKYVGETRSVTVATLKADDLETPIAAPDDATLKAWYDAHIDDYTAPEKKRITYALLTPDMVIDDVAVDDQAIRDQYEERIDEYQVPERRLVERLIFMDDDAATAAKARLDSGEIDFDGLVAERGLNLADIDLGDVSEADLGAAGPDVFAAASDTVVGPEDTDLGPALFRINGILAADNTSYEDAADQIREDLAADGARRLVQQQVEPIEDELAGGATLEDLAADSDMELGTIDWSPDMSEGVAGYDEFASAAEAVKAEDYPELTQMEDGGLFALRLDATIPAAPIPFEEVRDQVAEDWTADATQQALQAQAEGLVAQVEAGTPMQGLGVPVTTLNNITRNGNALGMPQDFNQVVFGMEEGALTITDGFDSVVIVRLDSIAQPDPDADQTKQLVASIQQQASNSITNDVYQIYANDVRSRTDLNVDQDAFNSVLAQFR